MKNAAKFMGIIALAVVIGFAMAGCENPIDPSTVTLTGITLNTASVKKAYTQNETLNLSGLVVTAAYSDSSTAPVTGYSSSPADGTALTTTGTITVTISYTEGTVTKTDTFTVTVTAAPIADITYTVQANGADNTTTTTEITFTFSATVTGLTADHISVASGNGSVTKGALSGSGSSWSLGVTVASAGNVTVVITKSGIEAEPKDVTVFMEGQANPILDSISAVYTQGSTIIYPNTPIDSLKAGLTVTATYSTGAPQQVTAYSLSGTLTAGTSTITVTYGGKETTFNVNVTATPAVKTLTGITLNTGTVKRNYNQNETLDLAGLAVTANYGDGSSATVSYTSTSPTNGSPLSTAGTITVTVNYTEGTITQSDTFTVTVSAVNLGTPGLAFELIEDNWKVNYGTYRVRAGTVTEGAVVIPATYEGLPVTEIGSASDDDSSGAFYNTSITAVHIPASVMSIGNRAFRECTSLTSVTIGEGVTSIGIYAFYGCTSLTTITIPESVRYIDYYAFQNCTSLTSVNIPASVTEIGYYAFQDCTSLTSITVDANNPNYASQDGILYNKAKTGIVQVPRGISGNVTLPAGLTSIDHSTFAGCTGLTGITIPESVTSIVQSAFQNCTSLTSVNIPASVTEIGWNAFQNCTSLTAITIPAGVTSIGSYAFYSWTNAQTIYVEGYSSQAAADTAWGSANWRGGCNAVIVYGIPTEIVQLNRTVFIIGEQPYSVAATVRYSDNTTGTVVTTADITGFDSTTAGTKTLTVTYRGITATFTVTVVGNEMLITNTTEWNDAITQLNGANSSVTLTIGGSFNVAGTTDNTFGTTSTGELTVTLKGSGTLSLSSNGNMLRIGENQTLIIDSENLILQGRSSNNASLVYVNGATAQLELRYGTISGNTNATNNNATNYGSAVGGGVYVGSGGIFTMSGGTISGNKAVNSHSSGSINYSYGGGVYVGGATFTMNGGTISGNEASSTASTATDYPYARSYGGGVYVSGATAFFTMNGGTISGNATAIRSNSQSTNQAYGGGVSVGSGATFRIVTGTVSGTVTASGPYADASGAALHNASGATAQRGTFSIPGDITSEWNSAGTLTTTSTTIRVVNGVLQ